MKRLTLSLLLLVLCVSHALCYEPYLEATVRVRLECMDGRGSLGTGVVIATDKGKSLVMTNSHVVEDRRTNVAEIRSLTHQPLDGTVVYEHRGGSPDVALITVNTAMTAVPISDKDYKVGTKVTQVGFPHGTMQQQIRRGTIAGYLDREMALSFPVMHGDSGSPVFLEDGSAICGQVWGTDNTNAICNYPGGLRYAFGQTQYCGPGGRCPTIRFGRPAPIISGPGYVMGPTPQQQQPPEINPPPEPQPPQTDPTPPPDCVTHEELVRVIGELKDLIAAIPAGAKGDTGPQGEKGLQGEPGVPGKDARPVDIDAIVDAVIAKLPPIEVENYNREGTLIDSELYPIGTPIKLQHGAVTGVK